MQGSRFQTFLESFEIFTAGSCRIIMIYVTNNELRIHEVTIRLHRFHKNDITDEVHQFYCNVQPS